MFEPLIKLAASKLDPLLDLYVERQRIIVMVALPGTLLFLLLFWAFSGAGGFMLILGLLMMITEVVLACGIFLVHEKYKDEIQQWRDVADAIEAFLTKADVFGEWTSFLETPQRDRRLEQLRINCTQLPREYPPEGEGEYCGQEGIDLLDTCIRQLRVGLASKASEDFGRWLTARQARRKKAKARKAEAKAAAPPPAEGDAVAEEPQPEPALEAAPAQRLAPEPKRARRTAKPKKGRRKKAEAAPPRGRGADMSGEAAALQKILDAGLTAHDFDRMQETILRQQGRIPKPNEVVRGLLAEQRTLSKRSKRSRRARQARAAGRARVAGRPMAAAEPVEYRVQAKRGGGFGYMVKFVFAVGLICAAPFAVWRVPKPEAKPVSIVGEVHHRVLDNPKLIRDKLRTPFEELLGNKPVSLMDGRRLYVSESDYNLCWPESWEDIYEKNYSVRITAEARPLLFGGYTPAKITTVKKVDNAMALAEPK